MSRTPYSKLLVIVRAGHGECAALACGTELALRSGAQLLLRAFEDAAAPLPQDTAITWLQTTLGRLKSQGLNASGELIARQPVQEAMLADIESLQPDLAIKELRHESVLRRLFFTAEDAFLAQRSPCPLLVVGEGSAALPARIVAAVDISSTDSEALNTRIVDAAARLADQTGADLHLAHVVEPVVDIAEDAMLSTPMSSSPMLAAELQDIHRQRFDEIAATLGVPEPRRHLAIGRIDLALEELCESLGAQTLVAGIHDRRGLERLLTTSTSEGLLSHGRQQLLLVRQLPAPAAA